MHHAVKDLGFKGVEISSTIDGADLSDRKFDPVWAAAEDLGAVVFIHPMGCSLDERLAPAYLSNSVGQPVEHAVALSHLIFGGVLDRHGGLKIVAAHGGDTCPRIWAAPTMPGPSARTRAPVATSRRAISSGCTLILWSLTRATWPC
jgi:aminocarboxymuconate-semialdehyde decarboxylase